MFNSQIKSNQINPIFVPEVFCVLVTIKTLNRHVIEDLIQKLFQSFAVEQHDFIEREDLHLHQLLSAQY